ncbi:hypothetical protein NIES4074_22200 [Cylindrospermum sp. NIES-4074]|nr:hypothetical protein NIES4074_22200 [Cylindrospermum sp. NIES-4074]
MYSRQHRISSKPSDSHDVPASNQFAPRPFVIQPQTEEVKPPQSQTADLQAKGEKSKEIPNGFPDAAVFTRHVAPPKTPRVQMKLNIGKAGDKYEQEADKMAANVVQQINAPESQSVQREVLPEDDKDSLQAKPMVQRLTSEGGTSATPDIEESIQGAKGSGQPLAENVRQPMEKAFGADFSGVKVHTDGKSDQLNQSIQAKAFTTGQDVFFRQGEYNPGSRGGQELLAHELTHVVQQNGGAVQRSLPSLIGEEKGENQANQNQKITPSVEAIQLKVELNSQGNALVKSGRFDFSSDLQTAMGVQPGDHRCHTISYETITNGVKDPINWRLSNPPPAYWDTRYLIGMVNAVFPNGGQAANHNTHANFQDLQQIALTNYQDALTEVDNIKTAIGNQNTQDLVNSANKLIAALNNSPDNLRAGSGTTNSSIQSGIDPTQDTNKPSILPVNTPIMQIAGDFSTTIPLQAPIQVIRLIDQHEAQIRTLLTETYSETNQVHGYSSGQTAQSSDNQNQKSANMTNQNPTPIAIEWPGTSSAYYLWEH